MENALLAKLKQSMAER